MQAVDENDPLYLKVFLSVRNEILAGQYDLPGKLPTEKALEERFNVSRITVRRALDELRLAGLIERSKGRSARLMDRRPPIVADIDAELSNLLSVVHELQTRVLGFEWISATPDLAEKLAVAKGDRVLWITRLRSRLRKPVLFSSVYLPEHIGQNITRTTLGSRPVVEIMRDHGHIAASAEQIMSAVPCSMELTKLLGLSLGDPVFLLNRTLRDNTGRPMLINEGSFRWDSFSYRLSLEPNRTSLTQEVSSLSEQVLVTP